MVSTKFSDKEAKSRMNNVKRGMASGGKVKPKKMMYGGKATAKKKK